MNMALVKEFIALENKKKSLTAELDVTKQSMTGLGESIKDQLVAEGINSVEADGRQVRIVPEVYAGPIEGNKESVIDALRSSEETVGLVTTGYDARSLVAYVRSVAGDVEAACKLDPARVYNPDAVRAALPPELRDAIKVSFVYGLKIRKA